MVVFGFIPSAQYSTRWAGGARRFTGNGDGLHRPSTPIMKMHIHNPISRILDVVTNHSHVSQSHVTSFDLDEALSLLNSERRRNTIEFLADQPPDTPIPVSDLAEAVAAMEHDCTVDALT